MKLTAYVDGGSRGNPGDAGAGVYIPGHAKIALFLGHGTNNFAEYSALVAALEYAVFTRCSELEVFADSELVVKQINGDYKVRNENIRPLYESASRWIRLIPDFSIHHVRREENSMADKLANWAMDRRANSVKWDE